MWQAGAPFSLEAAEAMGWLEPSCLLPRMELLPYGLVKCSFSDVSESTFLLTGVTG